MNSVPTSNPRHSPDPHPISADARGGGVGETAREQVALGGVEPQVGILK